MNGATVHLRARQAKRPRSIMESARTGGLCILATAILLAATSIGRAAQLNDVYGKRRSFDGATSVNGTAVLGDMFRQAGYRVFTWNRLSPKLDQCDVIIWAPDDFRPPGLKQREFLENWLADKPNRTVVYIGRDYTAVPDYWRWMAQQAPAAEKPELLRRQAEAQADHDSRRMAVPAEQFVEWMTVRRDRPPHQFRRLRGPWAKGIDASKTEIRVEGRFDLPKSGDLVGARSAYAREMTMSSSGGATGNNPASRGNAIPVSEESDDGTLAPWETPSIEYYLGDLDMDEPPMTEILLGDGEVVLVSRVLNPYWRGSQLLVVTNGSFLLNMPLVNHEHRKLAGKLIQECGSGQVIAFIESGPGGIRVYDEEPVAKYPTGVEMFTVWPMAPIMLHLAMLGILASFVIFPIFGRPTDPDATTTSDFGMHIEALGRLLQLTKDRQYAHSRIVEYYTRVRREAPPAIVLSHPESRPAMMVISPERAPGASASGQITNAKMVVGPSPQASRPDTTENVREPDDLDSKDDSPINATITTDDNTRFDETDDAPFDGSGETGDSSDEET